jgi:Ca-activated chloride channel family protein
MGNYKDSKIQTLAQKGNGNFAYLDGTNEAEKVLMKEFTQTLYNVAEDAYLDVQFDPKYVKNYRLIGFDNKVGAIRDTTAIVEGGEIGSAYSTFIAFEIEPTTLVQENVQPVTFTLKYKETATGKNEIVNETPVLTYLPYTQIDKCYQFASSVIMFGSYLKKSKYHSQKEFVALVEQAKKVYSKKRKKED